MLAFIRTLGREQVLVVNNLSGTAQAVELDLSALAGAIPVEMFGEQPLPAHRQTAVHADAGSVRLLLVPAAVAVAAVAAGERGGVEQQSVLSDALLRQLMAVGQVDVLVGVPTLNNASTVVDVARAVQVSFARDFPRLRTAMLNSDGGSTDGTPGLIRDISYGDAGTVLTSYPLRTLHKVVAPYHGQPGKLPALRTLFAAAELTQAKALVVLDPAGPATDPERVTDLVTPIVRSEVEFLAPRYHRHPRDGLLVTQLARPLVRAVYGVALDEPLGVEFACSGRFAAHCLERDIWNREVARFAIDLWLRTEAIAQRLAVGQVWRPATTSAGPRATLREAVQQVFMALVESLSSHESFWTSRDSVDALPTWGNDGGPAPDAPSWDYEALAQQARQDIADIRPLLAEVLDADTVSRVMRGLQSRRGTPDADELWVRIVYAFASATTRGRTSVERLAGTFVPLYLWRAATFMSETAADADASVLARLDALCGTFQRLKPVLVGTWTAGGVRTQ